MSIHSPPTQKVKIALREKGLAFERALPEDFGVGRRDGAFAAANPRTEVPVLLPGDGPAIFDSTVILEYIEERWPEPPLLPVDPAARAAARMIEEVCDTQYEAVNWGFGELLWFRRAKGELADRLKAAAVRDTATLQGWLTERLGEADWFGRVQFGWADVAAAPMVNRSVHYGLGPAAGSPLARWHMRIRERPSVAETFAEFDAEADSDGRLLPHRRAAPRIPRPPTRMDDPFRRTGSGALRNRERVRFGSRGLADRRDPTMRKAIAQPRGDSRDDAHRWLDELLYDPTQTIELLAVREGKSERSIRMTLSLAFVSSVLAEAAMEGRLPRGFCVKRLTDLPMLWSEQWRAIGLQTPTQVRAELS